LKWPFISSLLARPPFERGGGWRRFKYPKKQFWNSRKAGRPVRVGVKVAPDSGRIGSSGRMIRPVGSKPPRNSLRKRGIAHVFPDILNLPNPGELLPLKS